MNARLLFRFGVHGRRAVSAVVALLLVLATRERTDATPVFAQSYGLACTVCHTQMPTLNAFGRYVQRTGYAALNSQTLKHAVPVFLFDVGTGYSHQNGDPSSDRITGPFHSSLLQANGALSPDVTYKIEQFIFFGGQGGYLEQGWLAYHNLFNHDGHLFVGKLPAINLDEYGAGVLDDVSAASREPDVAVGVHDYAEEYDGGRWGAKFNLVRGKTLLQIAYLGNPTGLGSFQDAYDFSRGADRSLQWRVAYADPAKPYEFGVFGESGALGYTGSAISPGTHVDNYDVIAPYVGKDPRSGSPGFRLEYVAATDGNPGYVMPATPAGTPKQSGSISSSWMIGSVYQMVLHDHGMVSITYYHTNEATAETGFTGLIQPTGSKTGVGPGISYAMNPYSRIYTSIFVAQNQRPAFLINVWFTPPFWSRLK
jgi:hypothetical protein